MKNIIIPLFTIPIIMIVIGVITITAGNTAQAQINNTDKFFTKDYCIVEKTLFEDITYDNPNDQLSYDITACPNTDIIIHRWNELTIAEQNIIIARMTAQGYADVTPVEQIGQIGR